MARLDVSSAVHYRGPREQSQVVVKFRPPPEVAPDVVAGALELYVAGMLSGQGLLKDGPRWQGESHRCNGGLQALLGLPPLRGAGGGGAGPRSLTLTPPPPPREFGPAAPKASIA